MSEINFKTLQTRHEALLQKQQLITEENQDAFTKDVKEYIEQAKRSGSIISFTRERDQIRANLRYWANYIYSIEKAFPDTELAPANEASKRSVTFSAAVIIAFIAIFILILFSGRFIFGNSANTPSQSPPSTPTKVEIPATAPTTVQETEVVSTVNSPTPEPSGFNVILNSPVNGASITPLLKFTGVYENLMPGWAIHILFIKGDKYFPIEENCPIPDVTAISECLSSENVWTIESRLEESPEEMATAQSYSIVLAVSTNKVTRDLLSSSSKEGIEISSLPTDTVLLFNNTAIVVFRDPYSVLHENRLLFSRHNGISYDIYASKLDGSDIREINEPTSNIDEKDPQFSPDGRQIVYVKRFREADTYSIYVMDSNGENDHEIINTGKNLIEDPQWSSDGSYISYTLGDKSLSQSPNRIYWSVLVHNYKNPGEKDILISGEPEKLRDTNRYHSWIPGTNIILFNTRSNELAQSGFVEASVNSPENATPFFDTEQDEFQPNIKLPDQGYLLAYTVVNPDYSHDIYMVVDTDRQTPFEGIPTRLIKSSGEVVDHPYIYITSNNLYYARNGGIFVITYSVNGSQVAFVRNANESTFGKQIIKAGPSREDIFFDINLMDTFFRIKTGVPTPTS